METSHVVSGVTNAQECVPSRGMWKHKNQAKHGDVRRPSEKWWSKERNTKSNQGQCKHEGVAESSGMRDDLAQSQGIHHEGVVCEYKQPTKPGKGKAKLGVALHNAKD